MVLLACNIVVWLIWKWRNASIIDADFIRPNKYSCVILTFVSKEVAMAKDNMINGVGWVPPHLAGLSSIQVAPFCQIFRAFAGGVIPSHQVYVSEGLL